MRKRIAALLMILLLYLPAAQAAISVFSDPMDQKLADLAFIAQYDFRYRRRPGFRYSGDSFNVRGCGPASLTNAFLAAFSITNLEQSDLILHDMLFLVANGHQPAYQGFDLRNLSFFSGMTEEEYPDLYRAKSTCYDHYYLVQDGNLTLSWLRQTLSGDMSQGSTALAMGRFYLFENWRELAEICQWLTDEGFGTAELLVCYLSSGTADTDAPFRISGGHYLTVAVQAAAFLERGTVYLLDSVPRAISMEELLTGAYADCYTFVQDRDNPQFLDQIAPTRIQPLVVRFDPRPAVMEGFDLLSREERLDRLSEALFPFHLFGRGLMLVCLPDAEGTLPASHALPLQPKDPEALAPISGMD